MQFLMEEFDSYISSTIITTILEFQGASGPSKDCTSEDEPKAASPSEVQEFISHVLERLEGCEERKVSYLMWTCNLLHTVQIPIYRFRCV